MFERGGASDFGDVTGVLLFGNGVDVNLRRLVEANAGDLGLAYIGFDQDFGEIGDDGDHRAWIVHRPGDDDFALVCVELHGPAADRREDGGVIEIVLGLLQQRLRLRDSLVCGVVCGHGIVVTLPGLIEQLLRLDSLLLEVYRALVGQLRRGHVRLRARHFDPAVRNRGSRSCVRGLIRGSLEIDEALALFNGVAFVEIQLVDFRDDVRADVDLDLGVDFTGSGDDRLDGALRHRLDVDRFALRPAALDTRKNDDGDQNDRRDDDDGLLHLLRKP